jgi:vancomycin aglycone glucosyltransferase
MKVVGSAFGSRGDTEPMILLVAELRRRGHDACVVAHPDCGHLAERLGVPFHAIGERVQDAIVHNAAETGDSLKAKGGMDALNRYVTSQFEGFAQIAEGADVILASGVNSSAVHVAEAVGATVRWVMPCPRTLPANDNVPFFIKADSLPKPVNALLWKLMDLGAVTMARTVNAERAKLGLGKDPGGGANVFFRWPDRPILACDPVLGPLTESLEPRVAQTAAMLPPADGELPADVERFLAEGEPPVFIGFGSMGVKDAGATTRLVLDAVRRAGLRAVVARGWAGLASEVMPEGVLAVGELPFGALFPRMAVVVHHGGAGTTATAARAGVPQLVTPQIMDQFYWASRVHRLGLGPQPLPLKKLTAETLSSALREAVGSAGMRERARAIADDLSGVDGVDLTADEVDRTRVRGVAFRATRKAAARAGQAE